MAAAVEHRCNLFFALERQHIKITAQSSFYSVMMKDHDKSPSLHCELFTCPESGKQDTTEVRTHTQTYILAQTHTHVHTHP